MQGSGAGSYALLRVPFHPLNTANRYQAGTYECGEHATKSIRHTHSVCGGNPGSFLIPAIADPAYSPVYQ